MLHPFRRAHLGIRTLVRSEAAITNHALRAHGRRGRHHPVHVANAAVTTATTTAAAVAAVAVRRSPAIAGPLLLPPGAGGRAQ